MWGRLSLVLAVLCGSLLPTLTHQLLLEGWEARPSSALRMLVGAVVMGPMLGRQVFNLGPAWFPVLVGATSFAYGGALYVYGSQHAPAGLVISLIYLCPVWVVLYERLVLKQQTTNGLPAVALGLVGTLLLSAGLNWDQATELEGVAAALVDSFLFAAYLISSRKMAEAQVNPSVALFWGSVLAAVSFGGSLLTVGWSVAAAGWGITLGLVTCVGYPLLMGYGLTRVKSSVEASVLQYAEIVFVWGIALCFGGAQATGLDLAGSLAILLAGVGIALGQRVPR